MALTTFSNVCRLCLGSSQLTWVFDKKLTGDSTADMGEIVATTCGVMISPTDAVSQMICTNCCQFTKQMYKFRTTSICNDKNLKIRYSDYNKLAVATKETHNIVELTSTAEKVVHPSVQKVMKEHPNIKLPRRCLNSHIDPYICLLTNEVNEWYKGYNEKDIENIIDEATPWSGVEESNTCLAVKRKDLVDTETESLISNKRTKTQEISESEKTIELPVKNTTSMTVPNKVSMDKSPMRSNKIAKKLQLLVETNSEKTNVDAKEITESTDFQDCIVIDEDPNDNNRSTTAKRISRDFEYFISRSFFGSMENDPVIIDLDVEEAIETSEAPIVENAPDLSLVSVASKTYTLYTCKVCDSQHSSLKEMKRHEKKTHTKCPFCNKKCRSLANKDKHVRTCSLNNTSVTEKKGAENSEETDRKKVVSNASMTKAVIKIETVYEENDEDNVNNRITTRKLNVINHDIMNNLHNYNNDEDLLRKIITSSLTKSDDFKGVFVKNGSTKSIKIFKQLYTQLKKYKVLVDIQYNPVLLVEYEDRTTPKADANAELWYHLQPKKLEPVQPSPSTT